MSRHCPNCNAEIPEESSFCLNCFSYVNEVVPLAPVKTVNAKRKSKNINNIVITFTTLAIVLVSLITVGKIKKSKEIIKNTEIVTQFVPMTQENGEYVFDENGDVVNTIEEYEVVVENETHDSFFDKIFNRNTEDSDDNNVQIEIVDGVNNTVIDNVDINENDTDESSSYTKHGVTTTKKDSSSNETTAGKSFWDWLFGGGSGEKETTTKPTVKETTTRRTTNPNSATTKPITTKPSAATTKPAVTTTKPAVTTTKPAVTTTKPAVTTTKPATPTTTKPANTTTVSTENDFEWDIFEGEARLVKYKGNASDVVVPAKHNGLNVAYLAANAFSNNSNIRTIRFETSSSVLNLQPTLSNKYVYFNNLPNLTTITFPNKTLTEKLIMNNCKFYNMFNNCPSLSAIYFDGNPIDSNYLSSNDGVVFISNILVFYPYAKKDTSYTTPSSCLGLAPYAVKNNPYLKSFCLGAKVATKSIEHSNANFDNCSALQKITISSDNPVETYSSVDGVLYMRNISLSDYTGYDQELMYSVIYPAGKTDENFSFVADRKIFFTEKSFCSNKYLKTVRIPEGSRFLSNWQINTNIKKVLLKDCDDSRKISSSYFYGTTVEYY